MKAVRRWLIYRRLLNELADAPDGVLEELGTPRKTLRAFAWHCAGREVYGERLPLARHERGHEQVLRPVAIDKA
jgi:hypothetical protein